MSSLAPATHCSSWKKFFGEPRQVTWRVVQPHLTPRSKGVPTMHASGVVLEIPHQSFLGRLGHDVDADIRRHSK